MKTRIIATALIMTLIAICFTGCGQGEASVDVGKWAIIALPNGEIVEGEAQGIARWSEECVDVVIDGVTYTVHSYSVAFVERSGE